MTDRIIKLADERKEFVKEVDGFVYWWPNESKDGYLSANDLRILADELDRRNKPWEDEINAYFESHPDDVTIRYL